MSDSSYDDIVQHVTKSMKSSKPQGLGAVVVVSKRCYIYLLSQKANSSISQHASLSALVALPERSRHATQRFHGERTNEDFYSM